MLRLSAVHLQGSQFSQNISPCFTVPSGHVIIQDSPYIVIHLSSFVKDSENAENHWALPPLQSENLLQYSFWRFVDTQLIVPPRFRTHFAGILNSQLMYTVQLLMIKAVLPWYSHFRKHSFFRGFTVQISVASSIALFRSLSFGLWHLEVIASSASKTVSVAAEQRALLVFPTRNRAFEISLQDDL